MCFPRMAIQLHQRHLSRLQETRQALSGIQMSTNPLKRLLKPRQIKTSGIKTWGTQTKRKVVIRDSGEMRWEAQLKKLHLPRSPAHMKKLPKRVLGRSLYFPWRFKPARLPCKKVCLPVLCLTKSSVVHRIGILLKRAYNQEQGFLEQEAGQRGLQGS